MIVSLDGNRREDSGKKLNEQMKEIEEFEI